VAKPDKPADDGSILLMLAGVALGGLVLFIGGWGWYHRSSRYMPA